MIPHVSTAQQARSLVDAVKFPPIGDRGLDGASLDSDYLLAGGEPYVDAANRQTMLVVQLETPEAIDNSEDIAAVEGVDGLFIGTSDLGMRIRRSETDWTLEDAVASVAEASRRHGKAWGCPAGSLDELRRYHDQGAQLVAYGSDFRALMDMLRDRSRELQEVLGG